MSIVASGTGTSVGASSTGTDREASGIKSKRHLTIGCHLSSSKGYLAMGKDAVSIGADTFQFFTRNPRGGAAKLIDPKDVAAFEEYAAEQGFSRRGGGATILAHAPYTLNPASSDQKTRDFALMVLADDLVRMEATPDQCYNFHPGAHVGQGIERATELIVDALDRAIKPEQSTTVLLETMSGKGSEVGGTFEQIAAIIARTKLSDHLGVCLDTCHVWDAGYDIAGDLDGVLQEFDAIIGLSRLKSIHINDSMNVRGSHKDRHALIGAGQIGFDALVAVINHPLLRDLPFYLETPCELPGHAEEIARLREAAL